MRNRILLAGAALALGFVTVTAGYAGELSNLLTITPGVLEFNATGVGSTSTYYSSPQIYNGGTSPVTITSIAISGPQAADYSITYDYCPLNPNPLYPGQYCYVYLSFTPSAVGLRTATLVVKDAGGSPQSVLLVGEGLTPAKTLTFSPSQITFPNLPVGLPATGAATGYLGIQNTGNSPVTFTSASITGANASDFQITTNTCSYAPLSPGSYCNIYVSFLPAGTGIRNASLQLTDDAQGGTQSVPLVGAGSPPENTLQFFPTAVAFAPAGTSESQVSEIVIQNNGSEPVTINGFLVTGKNAPDFSMIENFCQPIPYTLAAQNQCSISIQFTPGAVGTRLGNIEIVDSATGSPQVVSMEGSGAPGALHFAFSPPVASYGSATLGFTAYAETNLQNLSSGSAPVTLQVMGAEAKDFSVSSSCPDLPPEGICPISTNFTPSALGVRLATLVATDSVTGQSQSATLAGSGVPVGAGLSAGGAVFQAEAVGNTSSTTVQAFADVSPVTITSATLTGPAASDFGILSNGCAPGVVLEYGYCDIQVSFSPSATGPRIAQIDIGYSGTTGSPLSIPLVAQGLPASRTITFQATEVSFNPDPLGIPVSSSVNIESAGSDPVSIGPISIFGAAAADFAITENQCPHPPAMLSPGTDCSVTIQFTPSALGTRLARLQVTDNASGSPQSLPLVGFGSNASPSLYLNPESLTFNPLPLGSSYQQSVNLSAYTGPAVSLLSVQVIGPNASDFTLVNGCPSLVTNCYVYITFTPSATGLREAELQLQDNAAGSPQVVPLAGMGMTPAPPVASISLSPIPLAFSQSVGIGYSASGSVAVTNTGTENILLSGFHIGGQAKGDFGIQSNNCPLSPAPLPPGQACGVTILFAPKSTGARIATFSVNDNASGSPQSINLVGEGVAAVKTLTITPTTLTFSPTPVGTTDYSGGVITLYNSGTVPVTFTSFTFSGPNSGDFSISSNFCIGYSGAALNPGGYCSVYLSFTPSATGTRTATLSINSDAEGSPQTVALSGVGE